jgi:DNA-binding NtrC family response regulator
MRILVVDDEASLLLTLTANLELEGFDVVAAENAAQALAAFEASGPFDLVLTDIRMPGMNGVELFRRIREMRPDLPVVLMTGFALEELVDSALREGAFTVLPKPCPVEHVLAVLARAARAPVVLVVDDVPSCAESTAEALCASGIRARAVLDADTALTEVKEGTVDVCVVDMIMPEVDGPQLMQRVRDVDRSVVFIAVSGDVASNLLRKAAELGAFACMQKPLSTDDLAQAIARARASPRVSA